MIVAVSYQFHDYEPTQFVLDTNLLSNDHRFERALKTAIEMNSRDEIVQITGEDFPEDDWGNLQRARIHGRPVTIEAVKHVHVFFDG